MVSSVSLLHSRMRQSVGSIRAQRFRKAAATVFPKPTYWDVSVFLSVVSRWQIVSEVK